jgi:hypothetical protein
MNWLSYFFFYTYIGLVVVAGFWGAFINPHFDFRLLFQLDTMDLEENVRINLLSQYRFLRALELGFGLFSLRFVNQIFHEKLFNELFLVIMFSGIMARIISLIADGIPGILHLFFMGYELIGLTVIYLHTRKTMAPNAVK